MSKMRRPSWEKQLRATEQRWVKECAARLEVEKGQRVLAVALEELVKAGDGVASSDYSPGDPMDRFLAALNRAHARLEGT